MRRWVKVAVGLVVSAALLWWVLHDVSLAALWQRVRGADPWLLTGMVGVATFSFVIRALRWHVLLLPGLPDSRFHSRWSAVCVGFMANNLLPARLGEFARAYALSRTERIGTSGAFASLVVERVFDGLVVAFFLFLAMAYPGFLGEGAETGTTVRNLALGGAGVFGGALVALGVLVRKPEASLRVVEAVTGRLLPGDWGERATDTLARFIQGLGAIHDLRLFVRAVAWTLALWLCMATSVWLGLLAFDIRGPGFAGALMVQSVIAFAVALPSSPGFFGPFEAGARVSLGLYGIDPTSIASFAMGYHVLTFIPVTLLGLWYVNRLGLRWTEMEHSDELVETVAERGSAPGGPGTDVPPDGGHGSGRDV